MTDIGNTGNDDKKGWRDRREERRERLRQRFEQNHKNSHAWTGAILLLIGITALLKSYIADFPVWIFSWQMLLIVIGLFIGIRHRFHGATWFILILVGGAFLTNDYFVDGDLRKHMWPMILILVGILFIFRANQKPGRWANCLEKKNADQDPFSTVKGDPYSQEDIIDTTSIFGGTKKNVLTKNFRGGDVVNVFGGTELNLSQSDINGIAVLELTTIFGGTKLIVPSNWTIRSEAVTIFGGIEDKRQMPQITEESEKVLVLRGTVIFGGIDIKSF